MRPTSKQVSGSAWPSGPAPEPAPAGDADGDTRQRPRQRSYSAPRSSANALIAIFVSEAAEGTMRMKDGGEQHEHKTGKGGAQVR